MSEDSEAGKWGTGFGEFCSVKCKLPAHTQGDVVKDNIKCR